MHTLFSFHGGRLPLLISVPHAGTYVPEDIRERMSIAGARLRDTDWHVDKLYEFGREMGASMIVAHYSRYVVDLNRSKDSTPLYTDAPTSPVCPLRTFTQEPIYLGGLHLPEDEIAARVQQYWRPYHAAIEEEMQRMLAQHGVALLWDAHSVASELPDLFPGVLPEFNLGTRDGASCPASIAEQLLRSLTAEGSIGAVLDGRFKGGYITQHYGRPAQRMYAVQLELAQRVYMDEANPHPFDPLRARKAAALIRPLLQHYLESAIGT